MELVNEAAVRMLEKNPKKAYNNAVDIILRLLNNVIKEPNNQKYRTIRSDNKIIQEKLLSVTGTKELLFNIGFVENGSTFALPSNIHIATVKNYRDFISDRFNSLKAGPCFRKKQIIPSRPFLARISFPRVLSTNNFFLLGIERMSDATMQYNDSELKKYGRELIPIGRLTLAAQGKLRGIQKSIKSKLYTEPEPCFRDLLLVELVNWFNEEFFEWINTLPCKKCGNEDYLKSEASEGGVKVEIGRCCEKETKFYRYNDITQLLQTRKGRCGEYANCFTFLCLCMDYDARYVCSQFDHVWTEVYSVGQKRWIHVDPSENVLDAPLMYQHGWKRKIDYILAYSADDIQDVTWRYSSNHKETLSARKSCSEAELLKIILDIRNKRQITISEARRKYLRRRNMLEFADLLYEKQPTEDEKKGRSSGSLAWKQERGEQASINLFVFEASDESVKSRTFNLRYSSATDTYERFFSDENGDPKVIEAYKGWEACQFISKNLFRKVERDWKMAYLAREEGTAAGEITWKFDFSNRNMIIKNYELQLKIATFKSGRESITVKPLNDGEEVRGSMGFTITAKVFGGEGDLAWQHSQIFRQSLSSNEYPFVLKVEFI